MNTITQQNKKLDINELEQFCIDNISTIIENGNVLMKINYMEKYDKIKEECLEILNTSQTNFVLTTKFGTVVINQKNKIAKLIGLSEYTSYDCRFQAAVFLYFLKKQGYKIEYMIFKSVVFSEDLTNKYRRIHLHKFGLSILRSEIEKHIVDINRNDIIEETKELFEKENLLKDLNYEYPKQTVFWNV